MKYQIYGYPVFCDTSTNYFESIEVQTILNLLKVIDNPMQDIPLVSVLRSPIVGITDNELVEIRFEDRNSSFFETLTKASKTTQNEGIKYKINLFFELLKDMQEKQEYLKLDELIWDIYEKTGYYNYVSLMNDGNIRVANLKMLFEKAKEYEEGSFKGLYNFINFVDKVTKNGSDMGAPKLIGENENVIRIMSIHKSKGLEFPIVFLSNAHKQFNFQDLNENILLHQDLGIGPTYINYERKIKYNTLAKEAIKIKAKKELESEEIRLLYVALTRAKEKIVITGIRKNLKKSLEDKREILESNIKENGINESIIAKAKSYLDYFELVYENDDRLKSILKFKMHKINDIKTEEKKQNKQQVKLQTSKNINKDISNKLEWIYPHLLFTKTEGKSSVSKINKIDEIKYAIQPIKINNFEETKITGANLGTIIHLVLQKLNYKEEYDFPKIEEFLQKLEYNNFLTNNQKQAISKEKILQYTKSKIFKDLKKAKQVFREKTFYMNLPVTNKEKRENILVQGIIDLYYIDEAGNIILVDYKTDYVENNNEEYLVSKYKNQLNLYKDALEKALKQKVYKIYIYSTYLNKEIEVIF